MNFADRLDSAIRSTGSILVAGMDPQLELFPETLLQAARARSDQLEIQIYWALTGFYIPAIHALRGRIAAIKPNAAFFEQYGIGGMRAFREICVNAQQAGVLVIADAKRGDIGSTATAYARAFLGSTTPFGEALSAFPCDALTVSPFLGFETLEPFLEVCATEGKGLFVLAKTSNPGSSDIQALSVDDKSISERVSQWISQRGSELIGECGLSSLGAVVGATHPDEARGLRALMPNAFFLIPGFGAQGASASDSIAGLRSDKRGGIVNVSRGLFGAIAQTAKDKDAMVESLLTRANALNAELSAAMKT